MFISLLRWKRCTSGGHGGTTLLLICQYTPTEKGGKSCLKQTRTPTRPAISVLGLYLKKTKLCMCVLTHVWEWVHMHVSDLWKPIAVEAVCSGEFPGSASCILRLQVGRYAYLWVHNNNYALHNYKYYIIMWVLQIQTSGLMLAWQLLYLLNHPPGLWCNTNVGCIPMLTTPLFTTAKVYSKPKYPPTDEKKKKSSTYKRKNTG